MTTFARELAIAERAALAGGAAIRAHYGNAVAVETKADASPVTIADRDANDAILAILRVEFPDDAILSEESADDPSRLTRSRVWIVDPLDGTRDFIARTGEFAVHVGLAVDGEAVVGAVYRVTTDELYSAARGTGATLTVGAGTTSRELRARIGVSSTASFSELRVGTSRLNASSVLADAVAGFASRAVGASVKLMMVASGELDAVVALSPSESEWDTCAPEVVVREAGGRFTDGYGRPFRYNQPDTMHHRGSLATNAACHDALVAHLAPFVARMAR